MNEPMNNMNALTIIDTVKVSTIADSMQKIATFQAVIQQNLKNGHDYGVIPGTQKPTLFKPGAEKILMLMGITSEYEVTERIQDYDNGFFAFTVKAVLSRNGLKITEGLGHANTRESRYTNRWVTESKIPEGMDKNTLQTREKPSKFKEGEFYTEYLVDNSDSFTLANTVLKMAKKRAQVDAVLTVASLSEIFTQDMEDLIDATEQKKTSGKSSTASSKKGSTNSTSYACSECGEVINQAVKSYSEKNFGKALCLECQKNSKQSKTDDTQPEYDLSDVEMVDTAPY